MAWSRLVAALPGRVSFAGRVAGKPVVVVDHGATRTTYEPVLALVSCVVLATQQRDPGTWALAGGLVALGVLLHLVTRRSAQRGAAARG